MGYEQEDTRLSIALEGMKLIRSKAQRGEIYPEDYPNILEWTREAIHFLQKYAMPQLMEIEDITRVQATRPLLIEYRDQSFAWVLYNAHIGQKAWTVVMKEDGNLVVLRDNDYNRHWRSWTMPPLCGQSKETPWSDE